MSDTYAPIPKTPEVPRLVQINDTIVRVLRREFPIIAGIGQCDDDIFNAARAIVANLTHDGLVGLPIGNAARTSVRCDYVANLGRLLNCRLGDDADDVLRTAVQAMERSVAKKAEGSL